MNNDPVTDAAPDLAVIINALPVGVLCLDSRGKCLCANRRWTQFSKLSKEQSLGKGWLKAFTPEVGAEFLKCIEQVNETAEIVNLPCEFSEWPGDSGYMKCSLAPVNDIPGMPPRLLATFIEAGELRKAEQSSREQLSEIEHIYRTAPIGLASFTRDMKYKRINQILADLNGISIEDHVGKSPKDIIPELWPTLKPLYDKILDEGITDSSVIEGPSPTDASDIREWAVVHSPQLNENGEITGITAAVLDITHRQKAIKIEKEKELAEAASREKTKFLANMSHEIRTPIAAILGLTEIMAMEKTSQEDRMTHLGRIRTQGEQLLVLINDILDLSKIEAGQLRIDRGNFWLIKELHDILQLSREQAKTKDIGVVMNFENDLPEYVYSSVSRFRQIALNLIGNSIKYSEGGTIKVSVQMDESPTEPNHKQLLVKVSDEGRGIPEESKRLLFQRFEQLDATTTKNISGTGLGLALSKNLARKLDGDVWLQESAPGKGSTFCFSLDIGDTAGANLVGESALSQYEEQKNISLEETHRLDRIKILSVEDVPEMRLLIEQVLTMNGATVDFATNGKEGVEKALKGNYDIILMDVHMPIMDGYQAVETLRKENYWGPIIALTARAMKEEVERCAKAGFTSLMTKPFKADKLIGLIRKYTN